MELGFAPVDEGGLVAYASIDSAFMKLEIKKEKWNPCPDCGEEMIINGRCKTCPSCGWSSCSL